MLYRIVLGVHRLNLCLLQVSREVLVASTVVTRSLHIKVVEGSNPFAEVLPCWVHSFKAIVLNSTLLQSYLKNFKNPALFFLLFTSFK